MTLTLAASIVRESSARSPLRLVPLPVVAAMWLMGLGLMGDPAWAQVIGRVSVATGGGQADGASFTPAISGDGRFVVFASNASNLVPDDTNGVIDIFLHDRLTRTTRRVSVASDGTQGNGPSGQNFYPAISADGRVIVFYSEASNLVPGDTNNRGELFVHDRETGTTTRISVTSTGQQANAQSYGPALSADGRIVAFVSRATNLDARCPNAEINVSQVYVHDRATGVTTCLSATDSGPGNGISAHPAVSADGRIVAFVSGASNLVPGDTNGDVTPCSSPGFDNTRGGCDVFVVQLTTGAISRVSVASDGTQGNASSGLAFTLTTPALSADGRFVAFQSYASNLVAGDTNGSPDAFVHDRLSGQTARLSVRSDGGEASGGSFAPGLSADGRFAAFMSLAGNLAGPCTDGVQIYVKDVLAGTVTCLSVAPDGSPGSGASNNPVVTGSGDARFVAFQSSATNLVPDDTNGVTDILVGRLPVGPNWLVVGSATGPAAAQGFDAVGNPTPLSFGTAEGGGVRLALADVDGDGAPDLIVGAGEALGQFVHVRVFSGSTADRLLVEFDTNPGAPGGSHVGACDFDGDGRAEIVTGPQPGGGTLVKLWRFTLATPGAPASITPVLSFPAYPGSTGGVNVACGVLDETRVPYVVTGAGAGSPPLVKVFALNLAAGTATEVTSFLAYPEDFTGGVSVAVGDVRRLGHGSIVTGPGFGFPPLVRVWTLTQPATKASAPALAPGSEAVEVMGLMPFAADSLGGVNVGAGDTTGQGGASLLAGRGPGGPPDVSSFGLGGNEPQLQQTVMAGSPDSRGGATPAAPPVTASSPLPPAASTTFVVVVQKVGGGNGTVTSAPAGIDCGSTCAQTYARGTSVTLTAEAAPGSEFLGWIGCDLASDTSCTVSASSTRLVSAIFNGGPNTLTLRLNQPIFRVGQTMVVTVTLRGDVASRPVDAYVVIRLPDGSVFSLQTNGAVPGIRPIATGFLPFDVEGELLRYTFTGAEPPGVYTFFAALVESGTGAVLGAIDQDSFTVTR